MAIKRGPRGGWASDLVPNTRFATEQEAQAAEAAFYETDAGKAAKQKEQNIDNLKNQILSQNTMDRWSGEGFGSAEANAKGMAEALARSGITDIRQFGVREVERPVYVSDESGSYQSGTEKVKEYFNKATGQAVNPEYAFAGGDTWSGTFAGSGRTNFGVQFAPDGTPYFYTQYGGSSSDLGSIAPLLAVASFIPGVAPFAQAINAAIAVDQGNVLGGLASLAGIPGVSEAANAAGLGSVVSGLRTANQVNNLVNAAESGNVLGALASGANLTGTGGVQIGDTGYNVADVLKTANIINAADQGNIAPLLGALTNTATSGGPKASDFIEGYFQPGGAGYVSPTADKTPDNIDAGGGWNPAMVTPQAPALEFPTVPTREEMQPSIDDMVNILAPYAPAPDDVPEMVVTAPRPDTTPDNIDAGGGWNPADVPDTMPDNIDIGGGWNPATGGGGSASPTKPAEPVKPAQPTKPAEPAKQPAQSGGPDLLSLLGLMGLMGGGQQQVQQPVQTPPAEVKSFEEQGYGDIFGTDLQFSEGGEVDELLRILRG